MPAVKRPVKPQPTSRRTPHPKHARRVRAARKHGRYPLLVHPVPAGHHEVLAVAIHLARCAAELLDKAPPAFSQNAAAFLGNRQWEVNDLAVRVVRAVAANDGSLITAADLAGPHAPRRPKPSHGAAKRRQRRSRSN